jgi:hypothetical protein
LLDVGEGDLSRSHLLRCPLEEVHRRASPKARCSLFKELPLSGVRHRLEKALDHRIGKY